MNKIFIKILVTIFIILLVFVLITIIANFITNKQIEKQFDVFKNNSQYLSGKTISLDDIDELPTPVKNWLLAINIVGKKDVNMVSFYQKGEMKLTEDQKDWFYPQALQYVRLDEPGFIWRVSLKMNPLIKVQGIDILEKGNASMKMLLFSLIPVVNEKENHKINESSLTRFLLELPWYPYASLRDYIKWEKIDDYSAKAIISYKNLTSEVIYYFDKDYNLIKMEGLRYKDSKKESKKISCIGEVVDNIIVNGVKVPNKINVSWIEDDKKFTWYKIENYNFDII